MLSYSDYYSACLLNISVNIACNTKWIPLNIVAMLTLQIVLH